jgi:hypothetical protein
LAGGPHEKREARTTWEDEAGGGVIGFIDLERET